MPDDVRSAIDDIRRWLVLGIVGAVPAVFWTGAANVFQLPKATLIVLGAVALLAVGGVRIATVGELAVPRSGVVCAVAAFTAAAGITTLVSEQVVVSAIGAYGRFAGAVLYLCLAVMLLVVVVAFTAGDVGSLVRAALVGLGLVGAYGLLQMLDIDPVEYSGTQSGDVVATLGNANLVAAAMAIGTPLAVTEAVRARTAAGRAVHGGLAVLFLGVMIGAESLQGPVALAAGLAIVALALILQLDGHRRRRGLVAFAGMAVVGATAAFAGLLRMGPLAAFGEQSTFRTRRYNWEAAWSMFTDHPLAGVGLGRFGSGYRLHRSMEAAIERPLTRTADTAHDVPLMMFAEGGVLLGLTYLLFVALVAAALVRGLARVEGDRLLLLGGVGGGWAAYQVQSLVSLDVPPLALLHFILAGAILVLAGPPPITVVRLPWAGPTGKAAKSRANRARIRRRQRIAVGAATMCALVGAVFVTRPLRADLAAFDAAGSRSIEAALDRTGTATGLAPWEATYWFIEGRILLQADQDAEAQEAFAEAIERNPDDLATIQTSARLAAQRDDVELARRLYADALEIEPQAPALKAEIGEFELLHGDPTRAVAELEEAVGLDPSNAPWWALLGAARHAADDPAGARRAYEQALDMDPSLERAQEGLLELS